MRTLYGVRHVGDGRRVGQGLLCKDEDDKLGKKKEEDVHRKAVFGNKNNICAIQAPLNACYVLLLFLLNIL